MITAAQTCKSFQRQFHAEIFGSVKEKTDWVQAPTKTKRVLYIEHWIKIIAFHTSLQLILAEIYQIFSLLSLVSLKIKHALVKLHFKLRFDEFLKEWSCGRKTSRTNSTWVQDSFQESPTTAVPLETVCYSRVCQTGKWGCRFLLTPIQAQHSLGHSFLSGSSLLITLEKYNETF